MLKDKIEKKKIKNKTTRVNTINLSKLQPKSYYRDNPIESKLKQIMKFNSQSIQC
jgi:hypothetical protein